MDGKGALSILIDILTIEPQDIPAQYETCSAGDFIRLRVKDTGTGIDKEIIAKIFDPFFTTKDDGSGLGLAITHGIVEQHNGSIEADSKLGHGTTFTIKLPLARDKVYEH